MTPAALVIELDDRTLSVRAYASLSHALVRQTLGAPAAAELDFLEPDEDLLTGTTVGAALVLRFGQHTLFNGQLAGVRVDCDGAGGQVLRLRGYDALHGARSRRMTCLRENASAATLCAEIAGRLGVGWSCATTPFVHPLLFQTGQSDLEHLASVAAEDGLFPILADGELALMTLEGRGEPVPLRWGRNLQSVTVGVCDEQALRRAEILGWRSDTLEAVRESAATSRQDALEMHDVRIGGDEDTAVRWLVDRLVCAGSQAQGMAQAAMDRAAATEAVADGGAEGDPKISAGCRIVLDGVPPRFGGQYVVTTAVHRFSQSSGYTTEFTTAPPPSRERDRRPVVTLGRVSDVHDPDEAGRCRVKLASFGDLETGWLQSTVPGAGKGRGLACLPEPHDTVLVVLPDENPANGFVLGGLYGGERLPRGINVRQHRPFVLRTAGGQALELGRDAALARLVTASGSLVELTPDRLRIAAVTDLVIEAPGKSITLRANAINLEQG